MPKNSEARFAFLAEELGAHVHVQARCGEPGSRGLLGELIMTKQEWKWWKGYVEEWAYIQDINPPKPKLVKKDLK